MTFDIRVSLKVPNGWNSIDKTFHFNNEIDARDKMDMVLMLLDKNYFDTYDEYEKTINAISLILEGYEYSVRAAPRKHNRMK